MQFLQETVEDPLAFASALRSAFPASQAQKLFETGPLARSEREAPTTMMGDRGAPVAVQGNAWKTSKAKEYWKAIVLKSIAQAHLDHLATLESRAQNKFKNKFIYNLYIYIYILLHLHIVNNHGSTVYW